MRGGGSPRRVTVLFLGGTISMTSTAGEGLVPTLGGADLLAHLADALGAIETEAVDVLKVGSAHLTFTELLEVARAADRAVRDGAHGVVVVQGTDSLEESAYLLDLLWRHEEPVVLTGAMRGSAAPGSDGAANLAHAVATAADAGARGLGSLVVLGEQVHAARFVAKGHTNLPAAFTSPATGPLGVMHEGRPHLLTRVVRAPAYDVPATAQVVVPVVTATLSQSPAEVDALSDVADGVVVAAFGAGHVNAAVADALERLVRRMPVVLASRTGAGSVHEETYGGPGSEQDLLARGLVSAGHLTPLKARLLLALLLAGGREQDAIRGEFAAHGSPAADTMG